MHNFDHVPLKLKFKRKIENQGAFFSGSFLVFCFNLFWTKNTHTHQKKKVSYFFMCFKALKFTYLWYVFEIAKMLMNFFYFIKAIFATGSRDGSINIWDIREKGTLMIYSFLFIYFHIEFYLFMRLFAYIFNNFFRDIVVLPYC